jgi:hypothetical protein
MAFVATCAMVCMAIIAVSMPERAHAVAFLVCGACAAFANWRADVARLS